MVVIIPVPHLQHGSFDPRACNKQLEVLNRPSDRHIPYILTIGQFESQLLIKLGRLDVEKVDVKRISIHGNNVRIFV